MFMKKGILGIWLLLFCVSAFLYSDVVRYGMGARALGMGNAVVGFSDDISSVYWNPAGLDQLKNRTFLAQYDNMSLDRRYQIISAAFPHALGGTVAFSWQNAWMGGFEKYDKSGNFQGYFENTDDVYYFTYGNQINKWFSVGLNLKYRYLKYMDQYKGDGFGVDLGFLLTLNEQLSLGMSVRDIATSLRWDGGTTNNLEDIPTEYAFGIAYRPLPYFLMDLDLSKVSHEDMKTRFGVEVWLKNAVGIRAGTDDGRLSLGASLKLKKWLVEYAYKDGELDDINRITATVNFDNITELASSFTTERDKTIRHRKRGRVEKSLRKERQIRREIAHIKSKRSPAKVQKKVVLSSNGTKMVTKSTVVPEKKTAIIVENNQPKLLNVKTEPVEVVKVAPSAQKERKITLAKKEAFVKTNTPIINKAKEPLPDGKVADPMLQDSKVATKYLESATELFRKGKLDKALDDILTAIRLDPYNGEYYFLASKIYRKKSQLDKAINALKQATMLSPEKQEYYISLGNLYDKVGEKVKSISEYKKAISIDPSSRWAKIAKRMIRFMTL
jgi:hypothetical protein